MSWRAAPPCDEADVPLASPAGSFSSSQLTHCSRRLNTLLVRYSGSRTLACATRKRAHLLSASLESAPPVQPRLLWRERAAGTSCLLLIIVAVVALPWILLQGTQICPCTGFAARQPG